MHSCLFPPRTTHLLTCVALALCAYAPPQDARASSYQSYQDDPSAGGSSAAADAYAAKQCAVALADLGAGKKAGLGTSGGGAAGAGAAERPFQIGTRVHSEGADLV